MMAVVTQPLSQFTPPPPIPQLPPGLAELENVDGFKITQDYKSVLYLQWRNKTFDIRDRNDHQLFKVDNEMDSACFCCLGLGSVDYHIQTVTDHSVLKVTHPVDWCGRNITMTADDGSVIGRASKRGWISNLLSSNCCGSNNFDIYDANDKHVFYLRGPCTFDFCPCGCCGCCSCSCCDCGSWEWTIYSEERGEDIGTIELSWQGQCGCCCCGRALELWEFVVKFPLELDPMQKALILGSVFLVEVVTERAARG